MDKQPRHSVILIKPSERFVGWHTILLHSPALLKIVGVKPRLESATLAARRHTPGQQINNDGRLAAAVQKPVFGVVAIEQALVRPSGCHGSHHGKRFLGCAASVLARLSAEVRLGRWRIR
jgi:hypothetical protein